MRILLFVFALLLAISPLEAATHKSKAIKPKRNNYNAKKNTHKAPKRPKVVHAK